MNYLKFNLSNLCWFGGCIAIHSIYCSYNKLINSSPTLIFDSNNQILVSLVNSCQVLTSTFTPNFLAALDYHGQLQTVLGTIVRNLFPIEVNIKRKVIVLPDSGTIAIDYMSLSEDNTVAINANRPIVIICHGLCGSSDSDYIAHVANKLLQKHFAVVTMIARGCGGLELSTPVGFSGARIADLEFVLQYLKEENPNSKLLGLSFSLGAGIMLNYMGKLGKEALLDTCVCICPPWDMVAAKPTSVFPLWSFVLAAALKSYFWTHRHIFHNKLYCNNVPVTVNDIMNAKSVREIDILICEMHGYKSVDEYYQDVSAGYVCNKIVIPTLAITAVDDPCCSYHGNPSVNTHVTKYHQLKLGETHLDESHNIGKWINVCNDLINKLSDIIIHIGPGLVLAHTPIGGHLGYLETIFPVCCWMDRVALEWFDSYLQYNHTVSNTQIH